MHGRVVFADGGCIPVNLKDKREKRLVLENRSVLCLALSTLVNTGSAVSLLLMYDVSLDVP